MKVTKNPPKEVTNGKTNGSVFVFQKSPIRILLNLGFFLFLAWYLLFFLSTDSRQRGGGACTLKFPWIRDLLGVCLSCYQWKVKSGNNIIELNTTLFDWDCTVGQYAHCKHWHIMSQDCMWYSWIKHSELRSYFCCLSNFTCLFLQHASENSWIIHIIVLTQLQGLSFSVLAGTKYSFRGVGRLCWRMRL